VISVPRWEGPTKSCTSDHFRQRYFEIYTTAGLPCSKLKMMNYSNMAMVWAEIVLHKDVDWHTVYGRNVSGLNRDLWMIPTNWIGPSDCWPQWSNRISNSGSYGAPAITRPHKHPSHGEEYNPYRTVTNDPPQTFSTTHEGGSHGYDYNPYHSIGNDPPQHSMFHTEAQAMAMTTVHTTLWGMILTHHLVWRMKGKVMAMTMDRIIQLLTSLPPRSIMPMNSQATTLTTIRIIVSQTILL
jgi:hypothetical protein